VKFEGIYTPAITPHAPDGAIDREAFAEVLESLIAAGVHGIIVGGPTGEYCAHSPQERFDLAAHAREVIGGRVPLIVGSLNHVPAFGEVEERLYSACCCNGLGTVKSTLAGMMAADLAAGIRSEDLDKYRDQPEPRRLPPAATLGARAVIRWQEMRAGREG
jgi:glycine/D-amino acid oxidase-like deaminating enzyme